MVSMYENYHSCFFVCFSGGWGWGETETLNLIALHDTLHTVFRDWTWVPVYVMGLRGIQILDEGLLPLWSVLIQKGVEICQTQTNLYVPVPGLSPLGNWLQHWTHPAFIFPLLPALITCCIIRVQWSSKRITRWPRWPGLLSRAQKDWFPPTINRIFPNIACSCRQRTLFSPERPGSEPSHRKEGGGEKGRQKKKRKLFPFLFLKPVLFWDFIYFLFSSRGLKGSQ